MEHMNKEFLMVEHVIKAVISTEWKNKVVLYKEVDKDIEQVKTIS